MLSIISTAIMPIVLIFILINGIISHVPVFDSFMTGAKEGIETLLRIIPALIGIVVAISMLRASGLLEAISAILSPVLNAVHFPTDVLPLALMRPISGSGSLGLVSDAFKTYGPDSYMGRVVSIMMGATETTFYTMAVYYGSVSITKTRHTLKSALLADLTAILASVYIVRIFFK